jgi:hypothetical protein
MLAVLLAPIARRSRVGGEQGAQAPQRGRQLIVGWQFIRRQCPEQTIHQR